MKAFGERLLSVAAALGLLSLFLVPSATAQTLEEESLEAEDVNTSFGSDEIRFSTSYIFVVLNLTYQVKSIFPW